MQVAIVSFNAQAHDAIGNLVADQASFFSQRGDAVTVFLEVAPRLHPQLRDVTQICSAVEVEGKTWDSLAQSDLVVFHYPQFYELLHYLPLLAGRGPRLVVHYHGVTPAEFWTGPDAALTEGLRQRGFVWCADAALTDSEYMRRDLSRATGFPDSRIAALPLPVERERFHPRPVERFLHTLLGLREGKLLLYVGRCAPNKRLPLLIDAVARLGDGPEPVHAVIVGDTSSVYGAEVAKCKELAASRGVAARVHFLGQLSEEDLPKAYQSADVLVLPSIHEGFCVPVVEAMASGLPVVASRSTALPETLGHAGLTFVPEDAGDLAAVLRRVLAPPQPPPEGAQVHVAVVSFRFGADIVGGAEASLRTAARALHDAGHQVEVFTTCVQSESRWQNDLPAGTFHLDGLAVHRFPIDQPEPAAFARVCQQVEEAGPKVSAELEADFLRHSLHSSALLHALAARHDEFSAVLVGPYLFGLTADLADAFPARTLVVPCLHDEAAARLPRWPRLFARAAGVLYHSAEEREFAQSRLGLNHPNSVELGTYLDLHSADGGQVTARTTGRPYVVYCGRYCSQKNLPLLLQWMARYQEERPGVVELVCVGRGDLQLPAAPWLRDLGWLDEACKRAVLAGARALVQLSQLESLSLVALEAWAQGTPVVVHGGCAVLAGQVGRARGGAAVQDYEGFAAALDDLLREAQGWRQRGANGRAYVLEHYGDREAYVARLLTAIRQAQVPIVDLMRREGLIRARQFDRETWRQRLEAFLAGELARPARPYREDLGIRPMQPALRAPAGARTALLPVRLHNWGNHAAIATGPGRTVILCEVEGDSRENELPANLLPGQTQSAVLTVPIPREPGNYRLEIWAQRRSSHCTSPRVELTLTVAAEGDLAPSGFEAFLSELANTLPEAARLKTLPADYLDNSEGLLGSLKLKVKAKLLHNFKTAYVDVLSRQQSNFNTHLLRAVEQLHQCCAALGHAVQGLQQRLDRIEDRIEVRLDDAPTQPISRPQAPDFPDVDLVSQESGN